MCHLTNLNRDRREPTSWSMMTFYNLNCALGKKRKEDGTLEVTQKKCIGKEISDTKRYPVRVAGMGIYITYPYGSY